MNKQEYNNSKISRKNPEYKKVRELLKTWKAENNITENCIIHHRDDTDETRAYNEEHYELWGCEEDGTFEYGKYVIFMTIAEHVKYHHTGSKRSEDTCRRISAAKYGHKQSYETRKRMSEARRGEKTLGLVKVMLLLVRRMACLVNTILKKPANVYVKRL